MVNSSNLSHRWMLRAKPLGKSEGSVESEEQATMLRCSQLDAFVGTPAMKHGFGPAVSLFH